MTEPLQPMSDEQIADSLAALGPADEAPAPDAKPAKPRRSRSGTSRAQRAAKAAEAGDKPAARPRTRSSSRKPAVNIRAGMTQLYTMAGVGVSMVPSDSGAALAVGQAMAAQADACATAWEQLAKENPRVKAALEQVLTVSSVGVLLAAHMPIVLAGLAASGRLDGMAGGMSAMIPEQQQPPAADAA